MAPLHFTAQLAGLQRKVEEEKLRADKAEHALRSMDREFSATRHRLRRAESYLRSLGYPPP